ncbi:MAG: 50S ribosomal protein L32 [Hadesarchaea archaeon DG-33-1]|nr:MAG: 50S ribosomal protein L32 [Hadesarchaea archaeon DG-33-1]
MKKSSKEKRRMPRFRRQEWFRFRKLGEKWRRPRGKDSKMRLGERGKPVLPSVGYKLPKSTRGSHPSGLAEITVSRPGEIDKVNPSRQAVRIASSVGRRKREQILARANELGIKVLNLGVKKRGAEGAEKAGG